MTHKNQLRILFVEDLSSDADLAVLELRKEGLRFEHIRVDNRNEFIKAFNEFKPDIIISDYMMPSYNGLQALQDTREFDLLIPFILYTGSINEETAVDCIKAGANDYVIKEHMTRLPIAVKEALEQYRIQIEKRAAELLLKENEEKLQSIFRATPVGIGLVVNRVFMELNDTFCTMTGYTRKELIGKNAEIIYATNEEYESAGIDKYRQIADKGTGTVETRFKCKDGRILNIFLSSTPLDKDDLMKGVTFIAMDITERKRVEKALLESQHLFQTLTQASPVGIFRTNPDGHTTYVNPKYSELTGLSPQEAFGRGWLNAVHPDDKEKLKDKWLSDFTSQKISSTEYRFLRPDGSIIWVMGNAVPELIGNEVVGYVGTITDITRRKQAEEALQESEVRYKALFSKTPEGILVAKAETKQFLYANPALCKMFGYTEKEIILLGIMGIHPKESLDYVLTEFEAQLQGQKAVASDLPCLHKNGTIFYVDILSTVIVLDGIKCLVGFFMNITERKLAEETIRGLARFPSENPAPVLRISRNGMLLYANEISFKLLTWKLQVGEKTTPFLQKIISEVLKKGIGKIIETKHYQQVFSFSIVPFAEEGYVNLYGSDITDRKKAEDVLRESESSLRSAQEIAKMGSWEWDMVTQKTTWSDNYFTIHGYKPTEVEPSFEFFRNKIHPDDVHLLDETHAVIMKDKKPSSFELRLTQPGGTVKWIQNNIFPVVEDDKLVKLKGVIIDITERKQAENALRESEEKFRSIMENSADALFLINQQGRIVYANKEVINMLGYTIEEVKSKTTVDLSPEDRIDEYLKLFSQALKEGKLSFELDILRKDGDIISTDLNSVLLPNGLLFASCRDITERKQIQLELRKHRNHLEELVNERTEELRKAKKEAEEANKAKSEFLANMSHEIRTPMNAVLGYTELLNSTPVDQTQKDYIKSIKSSGRSLLMLINDILDLSKIEAGKLDLQYDYIDTYSFFTEFERIFSLKVSEKGLKFILDITSGTPAGIYIDEARLRQIVFNLIGNAVKFTSEGKITLKVFTENPQIVNYSKEKSEELIDLIIEVQDTGIGISKELQEAIFEPFVQERDNKNHGGTGLGLTITRRLTALMDGTINVHSKPGKGSTFTVRVPEIAYLRDFTKTNLDIQIDPSEIVFEKASILIADDVQHNRSYLRDALKNTRLKIVEAEDGITAYKLAKEIVPDLIIADILMPKMDGFQLLDKIKTDKKLKHIPVIAYSASVLKDQKERIHNSEFAGLLIKPVKVAELYLELMNFLPYKSTKAAEPDKPLSEVDLVGEITNLPGLIHSLETGFYATWKTFAVRQPIGEIRDFGKNLIQSGMDHNSSIITGYGRELISAADSFNIEAILKLIGKYKGIIESLKDSTKNLNND
jgi:PAS domain S-box-containing protein